MQLDAEMEMMSQSVALLGKFIAAREPNIRYLGLVSILYSEFNRFLPGLKLYEFGSTKMDLI